jgi:hypothetical protein
LRDQQIWVLNKDGEPPSVTQIIGNALKDEPNLNHVRKWREYIQVLDRPARGLNPAASHDAVKLQ